MTPPVPILFTIPNFITAGSGRAMLNIIERLDRSKFAPAVCVSQKGGDLDRDVEALGIPFLEAPFVLSAQPYWSLPRRAWLAAANFHDHAFRIWHSFHYLDDYTEGIVARMSGARSWVYTKKNMNWHRRAWYMRTLIASRVAVQNTDMMRDFFSSPGFRQKARLIPRGVVTEHFHPGAERRLGLRKQLGLLENVPLIGCVAHLVPVKGHPTLLEALARVPGAHLLLAGRPLDETYAASLHRQAGTLGLTSRVHFLGNVADVSALLAELDIAVLPTWAKWRMEGCPVALLEAMASGKACVASDIPGARDLIEDGRSGRLVPPEDADMLARALRSLLDSRERRNAMGAAARERVMEHFTIEKEVAAHESLYSELVRLPGGADA